MAPDRVHFRSKGNLTTATQARRKAAERSKGLPRMNADSRGLRPAVVNTQRPLQAVLASFMGFTQNELQRFGGEQVSDAGPRKMIDAVQ